MSARPGALGACWVLDRGETLEVRLAGLDAEPFARAVELLKARIPAWGRLWSADRRAWLVTASLGDDVRLWADEVGMVLHWPAAEEVRDWTAEELEAFDALWLRPGAPASVVRAAWRALVVRHAGDDVAVLRLRRARRTLLDDDAETAGA